MIHAAVLGLGGWGTRLAGQIRDHPTGELAAVVDVDDDARSRAATEFDVDEGALFDRTAGLYEWAQRADTVDLDAVVIATPPALHDEQIHEALDHGPHVLCEKPVVVDRAAAERLSDRIAGSETTFMAGYQRHLDPAVVAARERYRDTDREPHLVTGVLTQDWTDHFESGTNWRTDPELGGRGHLFSVGTHVLEAALWVSGLEPESVSATMEFHDADGHIDQLASLSVSFENGAVGSFVDSAVSPANREHLHVWDDEGAVYLDAENWGPRRLTRVDADGKAVEAEPDVEGAAESKFGAFVEAIETGSEPPATAGDVLRVTALLDAAYESAHTGERVSVELG